jgi:membrane protein YqaA with SNARE-associated domain
MSLSLDRTALACGRSAVDALEWSLAGVFLSAFTSATLLPGTSEAALLGFAAAFPDAMWSAFFTASAGNTLGSMTTYAIGRFVPEPRKIPERAKRWLGRWGAAALVFAWVPVAGDALPLAAGVLRCPWPACLVFTLIGKSARYAALLGLFGLAA